MTGGILQDVTIGDCWLILGDCLDVLPSLTEGAVEVKLRDLGMLMRKRSGKSFDPTCVTCVDGNPREGAR